MMRRWQCAASKKQPLKFFEQAFHSEYVDVKTAVCVQMTACRSVSTAKFKFRMTASPLSAVSRGSAPTVFVDRMADERVARKLLTTLVSNQGVVVFLSQTDWHDFYQQSAMCDHVKAGGGGHQQSPTLSDFLSSFQHLFAFTVKAGGRIIEVRPSLNIGPCRQILRRDGRCDDERCPKLHCCEFFLFGNCTRGESCQYPHSLADSGNVHVLRCNLLDGMPIGDLSVLLSARAPQLCFRYNDKDGCTEAYCSKLHLCRYFVIGECINARCVRSHDVLSDQSQQILKTFGFNLTLSPDETLQKLRSNKGLCSNRKTCDQQVNYTTSNESQRPKMCSKYNSSEGCRLRDKCSQLHLCNCYASTEGKGSCSSKCRSNADIMSSQTRSVLVRYGFDVERAGADNVLAKLTSSALARKDDKGDAPRHCKDNRKDMIKTPQICIYYNKLSGCTNVNCPYLHLCSHFINDSCKFKNDCKRSHNFRSGQALAVLKGCGFDLAALSDDSVLLRLKQNLGEKDCKSKVAQEVFNVTSKYHEVQRIVPQLCVMYNKFTGCQAAKCRSLHLCQHFINGNCNYSVSCKRSHNVRSKQPFNLLKECGLDLAAMSDEQIISLLKRSRSEKASHTGADERPKREAQRTDKAVAGDSENKVCSFHLSGRCNYGDKCLNHHSSSGMPYQWQYLVSGDQNAGEWRDFTPTANVRIESRYCEVTEESCETIDDRVGGKVRIDFNQGLVFSIGNDEITTEVRRLGTDSAVAASKLNRYSTVWLWYWQKDDGLWQAFADVGTGKEDNAGSSVRSRALTEIGSGGTTPDLAITFHNEPTSSDIELQYLENQNSKIRYHRMIGSDNVKFIIDNLALMTQINMNTGVSYKLRRRPKLFRQSEKSSASTPPAGASAIQKLNCPICWDLAALKGESQGFIRVPVMNSGQTVNEYREIAGIFGATMPDVAIKAIYRIQNSELWEEFDAFQTRMNRKRSSPVRVERLFHGTNRQFVDAICQQGFDWRLNGMSVGAIYGKGSYFAKSAKFSKSYTQSGTMFVVKVIVGEYTKGDRSMVRPPPKDPSKPFQDLYDSCVNSISNPEIFVIFERSQTYPEYLIEF